jgi:hypothetical protein
MEQAKHFGFAAHSAQRNIFSYPRRTPRRACLWQFAQIGQLFSKHFLEQ